MSERVRGPPSGAGGAARPTPPRQTLLAYADPNSFAALPTSPSASPPTASASPPSAIDPASRATSQQQQQQQPGDEGEGEGQAEGQGSPGSRQEYAQVTVEDESAAGAAAGSAADSAAGADDGSAPASTGGMKRSTSSALMAELGRGLNIYGEKMVAALRSKTDEAALVEDHILESINYDKDEDYVNEDFMEKRSAIHQRFTLLLQFVMTVAIAFVTAMIMFVVSHSVETLAEFKNESVLDLLEEGESGSAAAYFTYLAISLLFVIIASASVAILAPAARGGGVPYVIAYLNGTNVMEYFSCRIVLVKSWALIWTIAAGMSQGMEGPFVFIGGGVAAILNAAMDIVFPFFPKHSSYAKIIRGIREERIFMAGGMAAGLAVAFDAPIAGVLFALEGATAFLSAPVVLRIFGCAMFASFFNDLGHTKFSASIRNHNLLSVSNSGVQSAYAWTLLEIFPFLLLALIGGVVGALATKINMKFSRWRHHHMQAAVPTIRMVVKQVGEVCVFCFLTVTPFFVLPFLFGCREKHALCDVYVAALPTRCRQAHCAEGFYSEVGTIVYSSANQIAALMFDRSLTWESEFHTAPLFCYGLLYWLLVSSLYGAYIPGGLFVPSIVVGGIYGRVVGIATQAIYPASVVVNPGVYSLLGAASMLGGFTRLALPVVIMLVELTGDATYLLPMMLVSVLGKFISDAIEPPLYPQHMALEHIPSLTDKLNPVIAKLTAKEIMVPAEACQTLCTVERLSHIKEILGSSSRIVFPLVFPSGNLAGLILRRNVMFCISHSPIYDSFSEAEAQTGLSDHAAEIRHAESFMKDWRNDKYDDSATITRGSKQIEDAFLNFTPYMDAGCMTARPATPAKTLAALFRRVGLSHLCITDKDNKFQGLITRRTLITPPASAAATAAAAAAAAAAAHGTHGGSPAKPAASSLRLRVSSISEGQESTEEHKHASSP